jgi:hypothetical protein
MTLSVNNRSYALPRQSVVVVCIDGCEPDYIAQAVAGGGVVEHSIELGVQAAGNRRWQARRRQDAHP